MKRLFIVIFFFAALISCDKKNEHTSLMGSWTCDEWPEVSSPSTYQVSIRRNGALKDTNQYLISNFRQLGLDPQYEVSFYVSEPGKLIINQQTVGNIYVSGTGTYEPDYSKIEWEYTVNGNIIESFKATYY